MHDRTDRSAPQEEPDMHPDIVMALMNEHMRELNADVRATRRADDHATR